MTRTVAGSPSVLNYEEWRTSFAEFPTHVSTGRPRFATVLGRSMAMDILKSTDRPYLEGLPHEILVAILSYVSPADLARLARTCRWLSDEYAGPGLWAELEMHDRDFHAHHEVRHPAPAVVPHESRSYLREAAQLEGGFSCPETRLLNFVGALDRVWCQNRPRFRALVSRVEALCAGTMVTTRASWRTGPLIPYGITRRPLEMPDCADGNGVSPAKAAAYLVPNPRDWDHQHDLLPLLTKLQRLEIHAGWVGTGRGCKMFYDKFRGVYPADWDLDETRDWDSDGDSPNGDKSDSAPTTPPPAPLPNLRIAKLSGYVPRHIVRYVALGSAPTLERLELAVLDEPVPAAAIEARSRTRQGRPAGRCVVPRALAFTSADPESESDPGPAAAPALSFPRLRHLHLSRPSPPQPPGLGGLVGLEVSWEERCSRRAEAASLRDWARILAAVQATPVSPLAVLVRTYIPWPLLPASSPSPFDLARLWGLPPGHIPGWRACLGVSGVSLTRAPRKKNDLLTPADCRPM